MLQPSQDITVGGRIGRGQYQYTLQDADLGELNEWAPKILAKLQTLPELTDTSSDQQGNAPQLMVSINRDQAARFGIHPEVIDATLNDAFGQRQVAQYYTQTNTYHVVLEVPPSMQGSPSTLDQIYLKSPVNGTPVPISTLVTIDNAHVGPLSVSHQGQFPAVTISFNLPKGVALGQAIDAIQKTVEQMGKPVSLIGTFQGNAQAFQTSLANEPILIAAALVVVYVILGMLYESYIHPLTILSTLPSAGVGALLALMAGGFDLSVIGIIGIILLIGIVKKNGIMLVDFAIHREREGHSPQASIREACLLRFRPILMTTMAAMLGGVPLMLGHGAGSELRQPLGYAMVGGLALSQLLTLYTTPSSISISTACRAGYRGARWSGGRRRWRLQNDRNAIDVRRGDARRIVVGTISSEARRPLRRRRRWTLSACSSSAFVFQTLHSLGHEPAKLLGLTCVRLHLGLGIAALKGHHALDVFGIGEVTGQREAGLCVFLGKPDRQFLDVLEPRRHHVRWRRRPHTHRLRHRVHELSVCGTGLFDILLRKLAQLLGHLEGLVLGHKFSPFGSAGGAASNAAANLATTE